MGVNEVKSWIVGKSLNITIDGPWSIVGIVQTVDDARYLCRDWTYFIKDCDINLTDLLATKSLISDLGPIHWPKALPNESGDI